MNNTQGTAEVPLGVFGGAVPEMDATDLPEGASPGLQDVDFSPGRVFTRGGRVGQFVFGNLFSENLTGFGSSFADGANEVPWSNPNNIKNNAPPSYASVSLNTTVALVNGIGAFDTFVTASGNSAAVATPTATPISGPNEYALFANSINGVATIATPAAGWSNVRIPSSPHCYEQVIAGPISGTASLNSSQPWASMLLLFRLLGPSLPTIAQANSIVSGAWNTSQNATFPSPVTAGNTIIVIFQSNDANGGGAGLSPVITDSKGNVYTHLGPILSGTNPELDVFIAQNVIGGTVNVVLGPLGGGGALNGECVAYELQAGTPGSASASLSEQLQAINFAFSIPTTLSALGFQVEVTGHQTSLDPSSVLTLSLINPSSISPTMQFQLPASDGTVILGNPATTWGLQLTPALFNNPSFGVQIQATNAGGTAVTFDISAVKIKAFFSPNPPSNFNWIKTYEQTDGEVDTLVLDATGILWDEDVDTAPGVLNSIATTIEPNTYAKSVTFDDVEYIALSDLSNGTDVPRLWNGRWLDRVSQVGPGAPPSVATTASGSTITSITQNPSFVMPTGAHDFLLVSAGPSAQGSFGLPATPGNVMTIVPRAAFVSPAYLKVGSNIQISGFPSINGNNVNNDPTGVARPAFYTITSLSQPVPGLLSYDWITFQVPFTTFYNQPAAPGCTIQATIATLTAAQQVPFLEVGNQFTVAGASLTGYDGTFIVVTTPNAAQLQITNTSLTANVAQYVFTLISGSAPVPGQFVTVTGTLNGNGIFNVVNAVITAASPTTFSISIVSALNITSTPEANANGIISGTIFTFDPVGVVTNPIIGNSVGGTISTSGVLGVGVRSCVAIFQTRNGALTGCSPPVQFNITLTASAIVVSNIPIGPPNTTARILAFTGAGGANYFWIAQPVTVTSNGQNVTYSSTLINDNLTTQVTLSFPDTVLLTGDGIDIQGNNLFAQEELGSCVGFLSYSDRLIAWGEQNKVQNFLNLSFDGGIGTQNSINAPTLTTFPLGWTVDPVNGGGVSLLVSPIFGNSFYIKNTTGGPQAVYGMIEQGAFQDQFQVPIITSTTLYSVRVTARCPSGVVTGNLVMDLFSPKLNQVFGSFIVPLSSMTSNMKIFTGTMLTTAFSVVPKDLLFRIYATVLPNNGDVELDRVEPFGTNNPVFSTQFRASYVENPEAFDLLTGGFGPSQNQQPIRGAITLFDTLYALKTKSWYSTSDNGTTEPAKWTWREVSNKVGTIGSHSFDYGEDWAFSACRAGLYFFNGGEPLKVSQEIQPVWDAINWAAGQSIWVRNDSENRKVYVGVPIVTPNAFMPEFPISTNPQTPNVILMMNYRELNSGMAVADTPPVRSSFSGRLLAPEPARKWSYWNIASPYADFINRGNNTDPLFLCNGYANSKVYAIVDGADDDNQAINNFYLTFGFVKPDVKDAKQLGQRRILLAYLSILAEGSGNLQPLVYPNSPLNLAFTLSTIPLSQFTLGDLEAAVNITGERFFLRVGTNAIGARFSMSSVVMALTKDAWSTIRGTAIANA